MKNIPASQSTGYSWGKRFKLYHLWRNACTFWQSACGQVGNRVLITDQLPHPDERCLRCTKIAERMNLP